MVLFATRKSNLINNKEFLFSNIYCRILELGIGNLLEETYKKRYRKEGRFTTMG